MILFDIVFHFGSFSRNLVRL